MQRIEMSPAQLIISGQVQLPFLKTLHMRGLAFDKIFNHKGTLRELKTILN